MTQTNPEQWAEDLLTKVREQHPHVAISTIQAAFAEREARLVGAERKAVVDWLRSASGDWPLATAHAEILADAIERGCHLTALKDRTHG